MSIREQFVEKVSKLSDELPSLSGDFRDAKHAKLFDFVRQSLNAYKPLCDLPHDQIKHIQDSSLHSLIMDIDDFLLLMNPPSVCDGWCFCLAPPRSGSAYDSSLLKCQIRLCASAFTARLLLTEAKVETLGLDSVKYVEYVNKMNQIATALSNIATGKTITDDMKLRARDELISSMEGIERFIKYYFESESDEFRAEALRRISATSSVLEAKYNRRNLVRAQASLQEIMNSAASISANAARDAMDDLDKCAEQVKRFRQEQVTRMNDLEDDFHALELTSALDHYREECEISYSALDPKIKDVAKRWKLVKSQSTFRTVVVYEEDKPAPAPNSMASAIVPNVLAEAAVDSSKMMVSAGKTVVGVGKSVVAVPTMAVKGGAKAMMGAANEAVNLAKSGAEGAVNLASTSASKVMSVGSKVASVPNKAMSAMRGSTSKEESSSGASSNSGASSASKRFANMTQQLMG